MLTAITVLAVVGGALAFKAKTFNSFDLYTSVVDKCIKSQTVDGGNSHIDGTLVIRDNGVPIGTFTDTVETCTFDVQTQGE